MRLVRGALFAATTSVLSAVACGGRVDGSLDTGDGQLCAAGDCDAGASDVFMPAPDGSSGDGAPDSGPTIADAWSRCQPPTVACGATCVDIQFDRNNCGACGHACPVALQTCVEAACVCPTASPDLCGSECVSLAKDAANCGACGRACGAMHICVMGQCNPDGNALATGQLNPGPIAVDANNIYWVNVDVAAGSVRQMPKTGGAITTLVMNSKEPAAVAVDAAYVYWGTTAQSQYVIRTPIGNPSNNVKLSGAVGAVGLALDAVNLYGVWGNTVYQIPVGGGAVQLLATNENQPGWLTVDATSVYWGERLPGAIKSMPIGGGPITVLASGQSGTAGIAVDADSVYWIAARDGAIRKVPVGGGAVTTLAQGQNNPLSIALYGGFVYWTNNVALGAVMKVPIGGGTPTVVAGGQPQPYGLAVDAANVYWTNYTAAGSVMTAPR